jgi:hypothetical protein
LREKQQRQRPLKRHRFPGVPHRPLSEDAKFALGY